MEGNTEIKGLGACDASPSAAFFHVFFVVPLVFAIFLSFSPDILTSSPNTGMEALSFSEEKVN